MGGGDRFGTYVRPRGFSSGIIGVAEERTPNSTVNEFPQSRGRDMATGDLGASVGPGPGQIVACAPRLLATVWADAPSRSSWHSWVEQRKTVP
jgi:hypothetical protein